jgi:hypothetical protein
MEEDRRSPAGTPRESHIHETGWLSGPLGAALLVVTLAAITAVFVIYFESLDLRTSSLGVDWKSFWSALKGGTLRYGPDHQIRFPPWSLLPLLPLGLLPMQAAWGLLVEVHLLILVVAVPRLIPRPLYWGGALLLIGSFPSLRTIADGNLSGLVTAGVLMLLGGYRRHSPILVAAGLILATMRPQDVWLLLPVVALHTLGTWRRDEWMKILYVVVPVVGLALAWRGHAWLEAVFGTYYEVFTSSSIDISLAATLKRIGLGANVAIAGAWVVVAVATIALAWRTRNELSREKAGALIAASLLLTPYASGFSVLTVIAAGIVPLLKEFRWLGLSMMSLAILPILFPAETKVAYEASYWTAFNLLAWIALGFLSLYYPSGRSRRKPAEGRES